MDSTDEEAFEVGGTYDDLGFAVAGVGDAVGEKLQEYTRWFEPKALRRGRRFELQRQALPRPGAWAAVPKASLKALLRKGLPREHRAEVWWSVLGCDERRALSPWSYAQYVAKARDELDVKAAETIERDLRRTFPNHRRFRTAAGQGELRNVLRAFAQHAPRVQYCQGLNFIAGMLLIVFEDEERAFWAMACAVEALDVEGYYTEGMTLLRADLQVLAGVLQAKCPKVAHALSARGVDLLSVCSEWYLTWFAKSLPASTILRVWDTLFYEGFKVLFRVAVGVFKVVEPEILRCGSFDDVMERAKDWPRRMVAHNELLKASFAGIPGLRRQDLVRAREGALCAIEREDAAGRRRREEVLAARQAGAATPQSAALARPGGR